jgi:hypothetical protein
MPASTYLANKLYDLVYRNTAYTSPATVYAALFTSSSSLAALKAGTLTNEVSGGSYARVAVTFGAPTDGDGSAGTTTFTTATAGWGTVRFVAIMDASTSGNVLSYAQLTSDVTINNGNTFQFNSSSLAATVD